MRFEVVHMGPAHFLSIDIRINREPMAHVKDVDIKTTLIQYAVEVHIE